MGIPYQPGPALTCQQIRQLDSIAIEQIGIPGVVLMENAGRATADVIYQNLTNPKSDRVLILCGAGNNGGDGFVVARHLHNAGVAVSVALAFPPEKSRGDAEVNLRIVRRMGLPCLNAFEADGLEAVRREAGRADVIVDALLGTGSQGPPRGTVAELVRIANGASGARRIAIDIPTGLDGDTGQAHEPCFRADVTVSMAAAKTGFLAEPARAVVGRVVVVDIGLPRELVARVRNPATGA